MEQATKVDPCAACRGFGYTKGAPNEPWEKVECALCLGTGRSERVTPGIYLHYKGGVYFVLAVGILDEDGHGDPRAPRQVVYESTRSVKTGLANIRSETAFLEPVAWPDGVTRSRFLRVDADALPAALLAATLAREAQ